MHGLAVYLKEGLPFTRDLSLENFADSYLCFWLALLHSVSYFFFFYQSPSLSLCMVFYSISSCIDAILSINPSANVFVIGDFSVNHKDWLTYSGRTDRLAELCYNFSISDELTQMVNFPTRILDCESHSPALLDLFISCDASICSTWLSLHLEILIMLLSQFPLTFWLFSWWLGRDHFRDVFVITWEMFHGRISLNSVLLLLLVNFVSGFRLELMCISLIENIRSSLIHLHGFQLLVLLP